MKEIKGFDLINEAGEFKKLPAGIYVCKITDIKNNEPSEYMEVFLEIEKGEYAGYFGTQKAQSGVDYSRTIRSYKQNALPFFKAFISAVEKTNKGYVWDWHEEKLIGKYVIAVFGEEEYYDKNGEIKVAVKVQEFRSGVAYKAGDIKVPPIKRVKTKPNETMPTATEAQSTIDDDDLPF